MFKIFFRNTLLACVLMLPSVSVFALHPDSPNASPGTTIPFMANTQLNLAILFPSGPVYINPSATGIFDVPSFDIEAHQLLVPINCRFKNTRGKILGYDEPAKNINMTATLVVNGVSTAYKCVFANSTSCSGSLGAPAVNAGDLVVWKLTTNSPNNYNQFLTLSTICQ